MHFEVLSRKKTGVQCARFMAVDGRLHVVIFFFISRKPVDGAGGETNE